MATTKKIRARVAAVRTEPLTSLEARRKQYEQGDTLALLHAIDECAHIGLVLPAWLANAFHDALMRFTEAPSRKDAVQSLDEAFHSPTIPVTDKGPAKARLDWALGVELWTAVGTIAPDHAGLDSALKQVLQSKRWGGGKTKARELVEMIDESQSRLTQGRVRPLSRIWAKPRKRVTTIK